MKKILIYIVLTFSLTWGLWLLGPVGKTTPQAMASENVLWVAAGMFMPAIAALLTAVWFRKSDPITFTWKPRLRGKIRYNMLAWFGPAVLTIAGAAIYYAVFPEQLDWGGGWTRQALALSNPELAESLTQSELNRVMLSQLISAVSFAPLVNLLFGAGEELGWRGLLYPALCERFGRRGGLLAGGIIWGIWHAPVTMRGHNYGLGYPGFPWLGIVVMCIFCTTLGVLLHWLCERSGTFWTAALAHGAINAAVGLGNLVLCADAEPNLLLGPAPSGLLAMVPLLILAVIVFTTQEKTTNKF